jgi:5'-nucleotidase
MSRTKPQILLTNDDGIQSPGLWSAAKILSKIGYVWVVAPREQSSGMGRSSPLSSDGIIRLQTQRVNGQDWPVYAVGASPAQAVLHGILEVMQQKPDLVVSGINYGLNVGTGITVSGTVGAAMESAAYGVKSLAVSLETEDRYHLTHSTDIDFSTAAHFLNLFACAYLEGEYDSDINLLKVEVPADATPETSWEITRLSTVRYYQAVRPERTDLDSPARIGYTSRTDPSLFPEGTDTHTILAKRNVSVTPLSLDFTSRVDLAALEMQIRKLV